MSYYILVLEIGVRWSGSKWETHGRKWIINGGTVIQGVWEGWNHILDHLGGDIQDSMQGFGSQRTQIAKWPPHSDWSGARLQVTSSDVTKWPPREAVTPNEWMRRIPGSPCKTEESLSSLCLSFLPAYAKNRVNDSNDWFVWRCRSKRLDGVLSCWGWNALLSHSISSAFMLNPHHVREERAQVVQLVYIYYLSTWFGLISNYQILEYRASDLLQTWTCRQTSNTFQQIPDRDLLRAWRTHTNTHKILISHSLMYTQAHTHTNKSIWLECYHQSQRLNTNPVCSLKNSTCGGTEVSEIRLFNFNSLV